jgi:hypothetical protein
MLDEKIKMRMELLQDQIDNLERSGYYTEWDIHCHIDPLKHELALLKDVAAFTYIEDHELLEIKKRVDTIIEIRNEYMLKSISIVEVVKRHITDFLHPKYLMTQESYNEGCKIHSQFWTQLREKQKEILLNQNPKEA